jgi:DUF971 family protein
MDSRTTPLRLNLKKDEKLEIHWQDGLITHFPIAFLRDNCPCASCKTFREEQAKKPKSKLTVLGGTVQRGPIAATGAQLVGGYALRIDWSDQHNSGIYSFNYLRELAEQNPS